MARGRATSPLTGSPPTWPRARPRRPPTPRSIGSWPRSSGCSGSARSPARSRSGPTSRCSRRTTCARASSRPRELEAVLAELPDALKPVAEVAYITGWRIRSELLTPPVAHVDFEAGWLRLEPGRDEEPGRPDVPVTPTLRAVLEASARTRARSSAPGPVIPWVFHRDGRPISTIAARGSPPARRPGCRTGSRTTSGGRPSATWSAPASRGRPP